MIKQGLNIHLRVNFDGISLEDVESIEFIFKDKESEHAKTLKKIEYPSSVKKEDNDLLVPFTAEETYSLPHKIFMDTRIKLKNTKDQPATNIVSISVTPTLFERGE